MIAFAIVLPFKPESGLMAAAAVLGISLTVYGIRKLVYYFTMARHMVGGLMILFAGIIAFDMGAFSCTLLSHPRIIVVLYLVSGNVLAGVTSIMRALEARGLDSSWRPALVRGIVWLSHALCCLLFIGSDFSIVVLYSLGLLYAGITTVASAFKRTDIIYIQ